MPPVASEHPAPDRRLLRTRWPPARQAFHQLLLGDAELDRSALRVDRNLIPIAHHRGNTVQPIYVNITLKAGDEISFAIDRARYDEAVQWLDRKGFFSKPLSTIVEPGADEDAPDDPIPARAQTTTG